MRRSTSQLFKDLPRITFPSREGIDGTKAIRERDEVEVILAFVVSKARRALGRPAAAGIILILIVVAVGGYYFVTLPPSPTQLPTPPPSSPTSPPASGPPTSKEAIPLPRPA